MVGLVVLGLGGCDDLSPLPVAPDGAGASCDHVWSSRALTRLACEFGANDDQGAAPH
jgi:hypothetical protein